jgi:hypothetical protein
VTIEQSLIENFVAFDDFCQNVLPKYYKKLIGNRKITREPSLTLRELMAVVVTFQISHVRTFKQYYLMVLLCYKDLFPHLPSYSRIVQLESRVLVPLCSYFRRVAKGHCTGISFTDSTKLKVCENKRIFHHKTFQGLAKRGKSTMGWFFGFKLHLVVNDRGDILNFSLTAGNVDDRVPTEKLCQGIIGKLFGDRGYVSEPLFKRLLEKGIFFFTSVKKNMKNKLVHTIDKLLHRKRAVIETINDHLKNVCQVEHSRHRSVNNCLVNLLSSMVAYQLLPKKTWN